MRTLLVGAASAALLSSLPAATPAHASDIVIYRAPPVYAPYPAYGHYPVYRRPYYVAGYVGLRCWRSAHVRPSGVVVYRRVCA